ncbi:MAG TPA: hypothetical protein VGC55_01800, partial [Dokdonella sp.]
VGDNQHAAFALDGVGEQGGGVFATLERDGRYEPREAGFDFVGHAHAARRVEAREHRMQTVAGEDFGVDGGRGARNDSGNAERPWFIRCIRWVIQSFIR